MRERPPDVAGNLYPWSKLVVAARKLRGAQVVGKDLMEIGDRRVETRLVPRSKPFDEENRGRRILHYCTGRKREGYGK
jgi:hypothetical protein